MWWYRTVRTAVRVVEMTIEQASRTGRGHKRDIWGAGMIFDFTGIQGTAGVVI